MLRRTSTIFLVLAFALLLPRDADARAAAPPSPEALSRVLSDPALWGKDFPAALAQLPSWRLAGESTVAVFADKMAGEKRYPGPEEAGRAAERLRQARAAAPKPRSGLPAGMTATLTAARERLSRFQIQASRFGEDDSFRVTWSAPAAELLPPGLTVAKVRERLGEPAETRRIALHAEGDRLPVILTLYVYLGGAVVFAERGVPPHPVVVDRVLLDVPVVTAVLFAEAP